jgi:hypothetical protein
MGVSGVVEMEGDPLSVIEISRSAEDGGAFILTNDVLNMKPFHIHSKIEQIVGEEDRNVQEEG